jgi:hypothetical protein
MTGARLGLVMCPSSFSCLKEKPRNETLDGALALVPSPSTRRRATCVILPPRRQIPTHCLASLPQHPHERNERQAARHAFTQYAPKGRHPCRRTP